MLDLLYVLSPGHSGSTLLGLVIGAHPQIATVGELKWAPDSFRDDDPCSCGKGMRHCDFWRQVQQRVAQRGMDLAQEGFRVHYTKRERAHEKLIARQVGSPLVEVLRRTAIAAWPAAARDRLHTLAYNITLMGAILDVTGGSVFLDTSKDASRLRYLSESRSLRIKVVHLIRDGRAVAYSLIKKGYDPDVAASDWVSEHRQALRLKRSFERSDWMSLRYETFCESPDATLAEVCEFAGVDVQRRTLDYRGWQSHVIGNRMRLESSNEIRLDTSWQTRLQGAPRAAVEAVTGSMNRKFGYA